MLYCLYDMHVCARQLTGIGCLTMQALSLKLGVATERDLAQACRTAYPPWVNVMLWIIMEVR